MPSFDLLTTAIVLVALFGAVMSICGYLTLAERKVSAWMQDRVGPNRVGPMGLLQPLADGGKMFLKEEVIPKHVDKVFYLLAPAIAVGTALLAIAVVPFGATTAPPDPVPLAAGAVETFNQQQTEYAKSFAFVLAPGLDVGMLYTFAIGSLAVYGVILAGWSANSKYSLLGSLRSSAQIISYEIPLGMAVLGVVLMAGSLNLEKIIAWQNSQGYWAVLIQPLAFLLFMTSVAAECSRLPFDLPEAEQELVGGYHTEYSSMKLGLMLLAEYVHMVTVSFLMAVAFFGGWTLFGLETIAADNVIVNGIIKTLILGGKMGAFCVFFLLVRWTIPRFRFDQLMNLAWKVMMPLALLNLLCVMTVKQLGAPMWVLTLTSFVLFVGAGMVSLKLSGSVTNPKRAVKKLPPGLPAGVTYAGR